MTSLPLMPREKLLKSGAGTLSDKELLAIFLRTGCKGCSVMELAQLVLVHFGSLHGLLNASHQQFCSIKGLWTTQFTQLQACIEIAKRYLSEKIQATPLFTDLQSVIYYLQAELSEQQREIFMVLFLDSQHYLIKKENMFLGTINQAVVHPREIIKTALSCNASALILAHNHPSGLTHPSQADFNVTCSIENACQLIDVKVLDHVIIGKGSYYSFAENKQLTCFTS